MYIPRFIRFINSVFSRNFKYGVRSLSSLFRSSAAFRRRRFLFRAHLAAVAPRKATRLHEPLLGAFGTQNVGTVGDESLAD